MTLICEHRVNDPDRLRSISPDHGVEIDLRSAGSTIVLEHDPFVGGPTFDEWLDSYHHAFIVLNIKEEGLEAAVLAALSERQIERFAFLDQSFPFLVRLLRTGDTRTMVRISEFEVAQTALSLVPRPDWVWVDSFTGRWPEPETLRELAGFGYRLMVVSPELQGRPLHPEVDTIRARFDEAGTPLDGVCTKRPDLWR